MTLGEFVTKWGFDIESEKLDKTQQQLDGIKKRLDLIVGLEIFDRISGLVHKFSELGERLNLSAESAGVSVEQLQKLSFAAKAAGVSGDSVNFAMFRMSKMLYEAKKGSTDATAAFEKAKISYSQFSQFKTGNDVLMALADRMREIKDPAERSALAFEFMGRGSRDMIGFLSQGSPAIKKAGEEAKELGAILTKDQVFALKEVNGALGKLHAVFEGFAGLIASVVSPVMTAVVEEVLRFYRGVRAVVEVNMDDWINTLAYGLGFIIGVVEAIITIFMKYHKEIVEGGVTILKYAFTFGVLYKALEFTVRVFNTLKEAIDIAKLSVGAFVKGATLLQSGLVFIIEKLAFATNSMWLFNAAIAVAEAPIWLIVAGVAALALGLNYLYVKLFGSGAFEDTWLGKLFKAGGSAFSWIADKLGLGMGEMGQAMMGASGSMPSMIGAPQEAGPTVPILGSPVSKSSQVNLTANTNITVPPNTTPEMVGPYVQKGISENFERVLREVERGTKGVQVY